MIYMKATIRAASTHDLDSLCTIEKVSFEAEAFTRQQIASLLTDCDTVTLVATSNDRVIGFIIGTLYTERNTLVGHILTIDVLPDFRRRKVGTELLLEIEKLFKRKGAKTCRLEVREDNQTALSMYRTLRYRPVAKLENYYGEKHGLRLTKTLA